MSKAVSPRATTIQVTAPQLTVSHSPTPAMQSPIAENTALTWSVVSSVPKARAENADDLGALVEALHQPGEADDAHIDRADQRPIDPLAFLRARRSRAAGSRRHSRDASLARSPSKASSPGSSSVKYARDGFLRDACERVRLPARLAVLVDHLGANAFIKIMALDDAPANAVFELHRFLELELRAPAAAPPA